MAFEGIGTDVAFVEKETVGGVGARHIDETHYFLARPTDVFEDVATVQGEDVTWRVLYRLHLHKFDVEVLRKNLKNTSDCADIFEKVSEGESVKKSIQVDISSSSVRM